MRRQTLWILPLLVVAFVLGGPACGQEGEKERTTNEPTKAEIEAQQPAELLAAAKKWREVVTCSLARPSEVQRYNVRCTGATLLDVRISDCCISGDHWEAKSKNWDRAPNTAATTSPGPAGQYGLTSRVYNYGGTPQNPNSINAEVDCSYLHGVDVFPAGSYITLSSDGTCTVTDLGKRDSINRTP